MNNSTRALMRNVQLFATDVDGILTDGSVTYSSAGEELKTFHIQDGLGFKLLQASGIKTALITGRNSAMVERRAKELGIDYLIQGRDDKAVALRELAQSLSIDLQNCAYAGDDLPDLGALLSAGMSFTAADAHPLVRKHSLMVCELPGGRGAFRQMCEALLEARGELELVYQKFGMTS